MTTTAVRRRLRRALAVSAVLCAAAGALVLAAVPAGADSSAAPTGNTGTAPGGGASQLGGFTLGSTAAGMSVFYEQPNFPVPATPTLEFDLGYSSAGYDAGPVGQSNASAFWPGAVVAGGGSQLPLLLSPYLQQYAPQLQSTVTPLIPNLGNWPLQATSAYPQGPASATNDNGPVSMHSSADQSSSTASSSIGILGGSASQSALPAGMVTVQAIGSTSQDTVDNLGNAVSEATSTVHGIDLAGGLIHVGEVTSTATSSSDGNQATVSGSSAITGVTVAGHNVTVDAQGVHSGTTNGGVLGVLVPSADTVLQTAGITLALTNPTDTVNGPSAERQLDGLSVKIDLSTYDQNLSKLLAMLPSQLSQALSQLPVPTPYKQVVTLDFGWVNVNAAASPAFNASSGDLSSGTDNGAGALTPDTAGSDITTPSDLGLASTGTGIGTPTGGSAQTTGGAPPGTSLAAAPAALFRGIGTGLIVLGLLLTALLVGLMLGLDRAVGRLAASAAPCVGPDDGELG